MELMRSKVNWDIEKERLHLLKEMHERIKVWRGRHPDLLEIFQRSEIERLLLDSMNFCTVEDNYQGNRFIEFVARSGYKNEPELDAETDRPLLRRTTILHLVVRGRASRWRQLIDELFEIYHRLDANYVDETGFTHYHAACQAGRADLVVRFLELQLINPGLLVEETGESGLHLALPDREDAFEEPLRRAAWTTADLLMRRGADPIAADHKLVTALHLICQGGYDNLLHLYLSQNRVASEIDARDHAGNTPLHLALERGHRTIALRLLQHEADPHPVNAAGATPLRLIFEHTNNIFHLAKMLYEVCVASRRDPEWNGRLRLGSEEAAKLLIRSDWNPAKPDPHDDVAATLQIFLRKKESAV
ncbi:unnamed protein product [Trichogramma brassicae]|uniref:Uncharacterized protein n=1 Tax=Trichogramma brassicae TaxID=86971 RepID=A0A6H5IHF0_9HYME|nr:unnamed protein product [Trichogramma brassicae]